MNKSQASQFLETLISHYPAELRDEERARLWRDTMLADHINFDFAVEQLRRFAQERVWISIAEFMAFHSEALRRARDPRAFAQARLESERKAAEARAQARAVERDKNDRDLAAMFEKLGEFSPDELTQLKAEVIGADGKWSPFVEKRLRDADPLESPFLASLMCELIGG